LLTTKKLYAVENIFFSQMNRIYPETYFLPQRKEKLICKRVCRYSYLSDTDFTIPIIPRSMHPCGYSDISSSAKYRNC